MKPSQSSPSTAARLVVAQLIRLTEERAWSPPEIGRRMGGKTGQWFRDIAAGRNNMLLRDAEDLSRLLGARLTITTADPWDALEIAIEALPAEHAALRRALRALVRTEREAAAAETPARQLKVAETAGRAGKPAPKPRPKR